MWGCQEPQGRAGEGGPGGHHRHPRGARVAGRDDQAVRGVGVGVDELDGDPGSGGDNDARVDQADGAECLIGPARRAGQDGQPDRRGGEGDGVGGLADLGARGDLAAERGGLGGADPGPGGVRPQAAHDLARVGAGARAHHSGAHHGRRESAGHPAGRADTARHPPVFMIAKGIALHSDRKSQDRISAKDSSTYSP